MHEAGFETYWVGGCVRDHLLSIEPLDYDIATAATPDEILKILPRANKVGKAFGVILVKGRAGFNEIATFRQDGPYSDGRRPDWIKFSDAEQDVRRRDFTVNGMLFDPKHERVIDFVGGQKDLENKTIRAIGNPRLRFEEDYLRLLRCIRFTVRLGFEIETETYQALCDSAPKIARIASERITGELLQILTGPDSERGLRLLSDSGLLKEFLPEVENMRDVEQDAAMHPEGDVFEHTCLVLKQLQKPDETLALAALLHDVGKPATQVFAPDRIRFHGHAEKSAEMAEGICRRLRIGNKQSELVCELIKNHMRFKDFPQMRKATRLRFFALEGFERHLELHRADRMSADRDTSTYEQAKLEYESLSQKEISPPPLISGKDIIKLGIKPGPQVGQILDKIRESQLEGTISSREEALDLARGIIG